MPRGKRIIPVYTGKAAKINEKVLKLEADLKAAKLELKDAYKEQLKEEAAAAKAKAVADEQAILKAVRESGLSAEEILTRIKDKKNS